MSDDTHAGLTVLLGQLRVKKHTDVDTVDRIRKTVLVDVIGARHIASTKHPPCGCDVVDFLRQYCEDYNLDLSRCDVDLNGHAYDMSKGGKIGDLAMSVGWGFPRFVIRV